MFFDALTWGYTNVRIRAMKGLLLSPSILDEMVKIRNVPAIVELLSRTSYKESISKATAQDAGAHLVEHATQLHFQSTVDKIKRTVPKSGRKALSALLERFDILNLKAIIGARHTKKPYSNVQDHIYPLGLLSASDCRALFDASDSTFLAVLKSTEFGQLLFKDDVLPDSRKHLLEQSLRDPTRLYEALMMLDSYAYDMFDASLRAQPGTDTTLVRKLLKREVDAKNIVMIERLKRLNFKPAKIQEYLISGGTLKPTQLEALARSTDPKALRKFLFGRFRNVTLSEDLDLVQLEISLERALAKEKVSLFTKSMFSIGVALGFLLLKEQEIFNLRKILKAKEFGLSQKDIENMLVVV